MRGDVGLLDIGDRTKVHAVGINDADLHSWRWRVYVPANKRINLCYATEERNPNTYPRNRGMMRLNPGEHIVAASLFQDGAGKWRLAVGAPSAIVDSFGGKHVLATPSPAAMSSYSVAGKTEVMPDNEPVLLIRLIAKRMPPGEAAAWSHINSDTGDGFQIWLEESTDTRQ